MLGQKREEVIVLPSPDPRLSEDVLIHSERPIRSTLE
jgi:hypothetical protein